MGPILRRQDHNIDQIYNAAHPPAVPPITYGGRHIALPLGEGIGSTVGDGPRLFVLVMLLQFGREIDRIADHGELQPFAVARARREPS